MAGKDKHVQNLAAFLGVPLEAACPIGRAGAIGSQAAAGVGGVIGAVAGPAMAGRKTDTKSDVPIGQHGWLGIGADSIYLTPAGFTGKPKGEVLLQAPFRDIESVELVEGKLSLLAIVALQDGRHAVFESGRLGANKSNVEVYELLRSRSNGG